MATQDAQMFKRNVGEPRSSPAEGGKVKTLHPSTAKVRHPIRELMQGRIPQGLKPNFEAADECRS